MRELGCDHRILFVEASFETIVKRYKETRRRHPLDPDGCDLERAVRREISIMVPLREQADIIIDTTDLTLGKLQRRLFSTFNKNQEQKPMNVNIISFGYKYGIPIEADLVFDVRFLPNPFYVSELRDGTGLDEPGSAFVFKFDESKEFFRKLSDMMVFLLPYYVEEGKRHLVVGIGCTGGRHRSVAGAKSLAELLKEKGYPAECIHRDIDKA
jgi:UPF0042 nucleotide-binding protein